MKGAFFAGNSLHNQARILIYENTQKYLLLKPGLVDHLEFDFAV
jgi:hypothetical protein